MRSGIVSLQGFHKEIKKALNEVAVSSAEAKEALASIILIGTSFKTSSIEFRERLHEALLDQKVAQGYLTMMKAVKESATVETCNRIELYFLSKKPERTTPNFFHHLPISLGRKRDSFYIRSGMDAILHLFELASGLDSMVVGEDQILSQLKDAATRARLDGRSRAVLSTLFDAATGVGTRIRASQDIPAENKSVSAFALNFALRKLGRKPKRVLLIGTGKMMKLTAEELRGCEIYVATRRKDVSSHFLPATVVRYDEIRRIARRCDLIISATKQEKEEGYVIRNGELTDYMPHQVILDLAFPRNIDPGLKNSNSRNIELYDLDDLAENIGALAPQTDAFTKQARRLIEEEAARFGRWLTASRLSPTLASLYRWAEDVRNSETDIALRRLTNLSPRESKVIEAMSRRLVSKLLAPAAIFAKESTERLSQQQRLKILGEIFSNGKDGA